jgi:hypothetical protein
MNDGRMEQQGGGEEDRQTPAERDPIDPAGAVHARIGAVGSVYVVIDQGHARFLRKGPAWRSSRGFSLLHRIETPPKSKSYRTAAVRPIDLPTAQPRFGRRRRKSVLLFLGVVGRATRRGTPTAFDVRIVGQGRLTGAGVDLIRALGPRRRSAQGARLRCGWCGHGPAWLGQARSI